MSDRKEMLPTTYVAFLRGINMSGDNRILRGELHAAFNHLGFKDVSPFIGNGNVRFSCEIYDTGEISSMIEDCIYRNFGQNIEAIIRRFNYLEELASKSPFAGYATLKGSLFYVSFLMQPAQLVLKLPYRNAEGTLEIPLVTPQEIFSVVQMGHDNLEPDAISFIESEFGRSITTRKWKTILEILSE